MKRYRMVSGIGRVEISNEEFEQMKNNNLPIEEETETLENLSKKVDRIIDALSTLSGGIFSKLNFPKNEGSE